MDKLIIITLVVILLLELSKVSRGKEERENSIIHLKDPRLNRKTLMFYRQPKYLKISEEEKDKNEDKNEENDRDNPSLNLTDEFKEGELTEEQFHRAKFEEFLKEELMKKENNRNENEQLRVAELEFDDLKDFIKEEDRKRYYDEYNFNKRKMNDEFFDMEKTDYKEYKYYPQENPILFRQHFNNGNGNVLRVNGFMQTIQNFTVSLMEVLDEMKTDNKKMNEYLKNMTTNQNLFMYRILKEMTREKQSEGDKYKKVNKKWILIKNVNIIYSRFYIIYYIFIFIFFFIG